MKRSNWFQYCIFRLRLIGNSKQTLYVIGNGFDIHHGLDTWYSSFGLFLKDEYPDIYDLLIKHLGMPELNSDVKTTLNVVEWNEFENSLANLAFDEIIDEHNEFAANPASDDYHKDLGAIEVYVSDIRDNLTSTMYSAFKDFINQIDYPYLNDSDKLRIKKKSRFFNFNYTRSLQEYYTIDESQIKYIHNHGLSESDLILGHGIDPESFLDKEPEMPAGLNEEEQQQWIDYQSDQFDISIQFGKDALSEYYSQSSKDTDTIIQENEPYFESLKIISRVIIYGHSLASVDEKYFKKILSRVKASCKWFVFYRN